MSPDPFLNLFKSYVCCFLKFMQSRYRDICYNITNFIRATAGKGTTYPMSIQGIIAKNRASGFRHHSYEMEQKVIAAIIKGDVDKVFEYSLLGDNISYKEILAPQPLRAQKNMAISMVAVVSRAIIEHGADAESVFFLSDYFLNEIEQAGSNKDLEKILSQMIIEYCNIAKEAQTDKHSSTIKKCLQQIHNQTYDKCTVEGISENLKISSDYLSVLFKREMGTGLYSYILNVKIEEAKSLLDNSNFSISDIGESLGFCNGAYFSNVFKKLTGMCPKDYRMKKSSHAAVK